MLRHLGEAQQGADAVHGAVEHGEEQDGQGGEHDVEGGRGDVVHHGLPAVAAVELRGRTTIWNLERQAASRMLSQPGQLPSVIAGESLPRKLPSWREKQGWPGTLQCGGLDERGRLIWGEEMARRMRVRGRAPDLVVEEQEAEGDVLVEGVLDQARDAVRAERAVHQQQPRQEPAAARMRISICAQNTRGIMACQQERAQRTRIRIRLK